VLLRRPPYPPLGPDNRPTAVKNASAHRTTEHSTAHGPPPLGHPPRINADDINTYTSAKNGRTRVTEKRPNPPALPRRTAKRAAAICTARFPARWQTSGQDPPPRESPLTARADIRHSGGCHRHRPGRNASPGRIPTPRPGKLRVRTQCWLARQPPSVLRGRPEQSSTYNFPGPHRRAPEKKHNRCRSYSCHVAVHREQRQSWAGGTSLPLCPASKAAADVTWGLACTPLPPGPPSSHNCQNGYLNTPSPLVTWATDAPSPLSQPVMREDCGRSGWEPRPRRKSARRITAPRGETTPPRTLLAGMANNPTPSTRIPTKRTCRLAPRSPGQPTYQLRLNPKDFPRHLGKAALIPKHPLSALLPTIDAPY